MDHKNYKKHSWFLVASLHEDDKILDLSTLHQKQNNLEIDLDLSFTYSKWEITFLVTVQYL